MCLSCLRAGDLNITPTTGNWKYFQEALRWAVLNFCLCASSLNTLNTVGRVFIFLFETVSLDFEGPTGFSLKVWHYSFPNSGHKNTTNLGFYFYFQKHFCSWFDMITTFWMCQLPHLRAVWGFLFALRKQKVCSEVHVDSTVFYLWKHKHYC